MSKHKCELCGTAVKVVGKTTKHYEPLSSVASAVSVDEIKKIIIKQSDEYAGVGHRYKVIPEVRFNRLAKAIHDLLTEGKGER